MEKNRILLFLVNNHLHGYCILDPEYNNIKVYLLDLISNNVKTKERIY